MSASDDATAAAGVHLTDNYSLWVLPPPGPLRQRLQAEIDALAEKYGGPKFPAHVTVLPDIKQPRDQLLATAASLAAQLPPYDITLLSVSCGAIYHQCVYLLCAKDVDTVAAAAAARRAYGMPPPPDKPYMPHLSLLYSDIDPDTRRAVAADVTRRLFGEGSGYDTLLTETSFRAGSLAVWYTPVEDKSLASWKEVAEFPLTGGHPAEGGLHAAQQQ